MNADFSLARELTGNLIHNIYRDPDWSKNVLEKTSSSSQNPAVPEQGTKQLPVLPKITDGSVRANQFGIGNIIEEDNAYPAYQSAAYAVADDEENPLSNAQFRCVGSRGSDLYIQIQSTPQKRRTRSFAALDYIAYEMEVKNSGIRNKLCLKKINDTIGFGVFLKPTKKRICPGEFIGIYAGDLRVTQKNCPHMDPVYCYHLFTLKEEQKKLLPPDSSSLLVDARHSGNFTRFLNHSYNPNCLADLVLSPYGKYEIGFFADRTINPGEQLLIDYGSCYWEGKNVFYPFKLSPTLFRLTTGGTIEQKVRVLRNISMPLATIDSNFKIQNAIAAVKPQYVYGTNSFLSLYKIVADSKLPKNLSIRLVTSWNKAVVFLDPKARPIPTGADLAILGGKFDLVESVDGKCLAKGAVIQKSSKSGEEPALVLDVKSSKNFANKIVHSNSPNVSRIICDISKILNQLPEGTAKIQVVYRAIRKILPGEPITCDYGREYEKVFPDALTLDPKKCMLQSDNTLRLENEIFETSALDLARDS